MNIKTYMAIALAAISVSIASTQAGEATAEFRWGNTANQYKAEFSEKFKSEDFGTFVVAGELESKQGYNDGKLDTVLSGTLGYVINAPFGVTVQPFVQIGEKLNSGANQSNFVGQGVKVSRAIYGPVSGEVAYRHRGSYSNQDLSENRVAASLKYKLSDRHAVGVAAYNYSGLSTDHRYGVFYKYTL